MSLLKLLSFCLVFLELETYSERQMLLNKAIWNHDKVPLLFIIIRNLTTESCDIEALVDQVD